MTEENPTTKSESSEQTPKQPISIPFAIVVCFIWGVCAWLTYLFIILLKPWASELHSVVVSGGNDDLHTIIILIAYISTLAGMALPLLAGSSLVAGALAGRR